MPPKKSKDTSVAVADAPEAKSTSKKAEAVDAATAVAQKPKPKGKASKRSRDDDDDEEKKDAKPTPTVNENPELINAFETLAFFEFNFGNKFAALAHLKCADIINRRFMNKLTASKDIPWNFGESDGCVRSEFLGRGHRHLIDEFLTDNKHTFNRLEELKAENSDAKVVIDEAFRIAVRATEVVGTPPDAATIAKIAAEVPKLQSSNVDALKAILRSNRQPVTGVKSELIRRVSEGVVMGALPACPSCYGGKLKYDIESGVYSCGGFMDDDEYQFCYYRAATADRNPWQN